jgi:hypothetical protein
MHPIESPSKEIRSLRILATNSAESNGSGNGSQSISEDFGRMLGGLGELTALGVMATGVTRLGAGVEFATTFNGRRSHEANTSTKKTIMPPPVNRSSLPSCSGIIWPASYLHTNARAART